MLGRTSSTGRSTNFRSIGTEPLSQLRSSVAIATSAGDAEAAANRLSFGNGRPNDQTGDLTVRAGGEKRPIEKDVHKPFGLRRPPLIHSKAPRLTTSPDTGPQPRQSHRAFAALHTPGFAIYLLGSAVAMMADSIEHVI